MIFKKMIEKIKKKLEEFYGFKSPDFLIEVCESRKDFEEKTGKKETPDWLVGFANNRKIYILDPEAMERESSHKKEEFEQILTHEICHIFHYQINKNILTWVDEGVASFVAGQNKKPDFNKEDVNKFFNGPFDPEKGYRISYWAIKTVFDLGGKEMVLELAKVNRQDSDRGSRIDKILGMKKDEFIDRIMRSF